MTRLRPKEPDQFRIDDIGRFFVGVVTDFRNQKHLAIGKDARGMPGFFHIGWIVLLATQDQGWSFDVLPIVNYGIHAPHMVG